MNGEPPKSLSSNQLVLQYIQRNGDRPPTLANIAERMHCSPNQVFEAVKTLLSLGQVHVTRSHGTLVYEARRGR